MLDIAAPEILAMLGVSHPRDEPISALSFVHRIEEGLSVASLRAVGDAIAPGDKSFVFKVIPKATFERRKGKTLTSEESGRVARLAKIWECAMEVWQDRSAARAFLHRGHPLLDGRTPLDLALGSELGARLVEDILGQLKYGTAA